MSLTKGSIEQNIRQHFNDAQASTATHRKLVNSLLHIHEGQAKKGLEEEIEFTKEFLRNIFRILPLKKKELTADRIIKFCAHYIQHIQDKMKKSETCKQNEDESEETIASRLVRSLFDHLLPGLESKDKYVRLRICQIITLVINCMEEIDDDLFQLLKKALEKRLRDKEPSIRVQAVIAASRFQNSEEDVNSDSIKKIFLHLIQHDSNAEVRRSVILNLEKSVETLPFIIERARDTDSINRRTIFSRTLPEMGDFRQLSIGKREKILRWGIKDRNDQVKKAAVKMFSTIWIEHVNNNLLELLERLDVINSKIAEDAMNSFFSMRIDVVKTITFDSDFWENITPESAFLVRCWNDFCIKEGYTHLLEEKIPEISQQALYIEKILENFENSTDENKQELEFILEQILLIIKTTDFSDEMGRKNIFNILQNNIPNFIFSENLITHMVEVFQKIVSDERTYVKLLMEIILDLYDSLDIRTNKNKDNKEDTRSEDSFVSAVSNQDNAVSYISIDSIIKRETEESSESHKTLIIFRCLHLTQVMLENIEKNLQNNFEFIEILHNLIIPSVRSHNAPIREKSLRCLGLCCLLDKKLAKENLVLFCHCLVKGHDSLQIEAIKIMTDIFMSYKYDIFDDSSTDLHSIQLLYEQVLQNTSNLDIMATAVEAVAKLMLTSFFDDPKLLKTLIILYFHPGTASNLHLRQILAYFIPAYCYSLPKNQFCLQKIFVSTLHKLSQIFDNLEDVEYISFSQIALQMMDWIDPKKLINSDTFKNQSQYTKTNENIYLYLAKDICTQIAESYNKEKRTLCSLLNKLHITYVSDQQLAHSIQTIINTLLQENTLDSFTKNSLNKFSNALYKFTQSNQTN
ncbi:hypothetical protein PNEG_02450 [Pneumocystis murina B123]|uniref:Nuclear condensin complex subunit 3 C-terminal domain-containing protein n=1 Tax=Pneumocystis murina (strain B123) TaxID=1069680 RepID=M7NPS3_PNEMU|nr:hypothetical protein PNEG_02450 [Pneumocystis murina B123]EMR09106.1 hypothetical protein PNEG_02450 [Pneumocystis murina B123]